MAEGDKPFCNKLYALRGDHVVFVTSERISKIVREVFELKDLRWVAGTQEEGSRDFMMRLWIRPDMFDVSGKNLVFFAFGESTLKEASAFLDAWRYSPFYHCGGAACF